MPYFSTARNELGVLMARRSVIPAIAYRHPRTRVSKLKYTISIGAITLLLCGRSSISGQLMMPLSWQQMADERGAHN